MPWRTGCGTTVAVGPRHRPVDRPVDRHVHAHGRRGSAPRRDPSRGWSGSGAAAQADSASTRRALPGPSVSIVSARRRLLLAPRISGLRPGMPPPRRTGIADLTPARNPFPGPSISTSVRPRRTTEGAAHGIGSRLGWPSSGSPCPRRRRRRRTTCRGCGAATSSTSPARSAATRTGCITRQARRRRRRRRRRRGGPHLRPARSSPSSGPPAAATSTASSGSSSSPASSTRRPTSPTSPRWSTAASDLIVEVFGDRGRHARSAVGVGGAAARGRGRGGRCLRDRLSCRPPSSAAPIAHRGLHDRARGRRREQPRRRRGGDRRRLRHRARRPALRRRRGDGVPRRRDAAADRRARPRRATTPPPRSAASRCSAAAETVPTLAEFLALVAGRAPLLDRDQGPGRRARPRRRPAGGAGRGAPRRLRRRRWR